MSDRNLLFWLSVFGTVVNGLNEEYIEGWYEVQETGKEKKTNYILLYTIMNQNSGFMAKTGF